MRVQASKQILTAAASLAALFCLSGPAVAADEGAEESRIVVTDTRGRPPFKRVRVTSEAEFARLETESTAASASRPADFRGRPPFARHAAADAEPGEATFARFEESTERRVRRWGPPGKATSRR